MFQRSLLHQTDPVNGNEMFKGIDLLDTRHLEYQRYIQWVNFNFIQKLRPFINEYILHNPEDINIPPEIYGHPVRYGYLHEWLGFLTRETGIWLVDKFPENTNPVDITSYAIRAFYQTEDFRTRNPHVYFRNESGNELNILPTFPIVELNQHPLFNLVLAEQLYNEGYLEKLQKITNPDLGDISIVIPDTLNNPFSVSYNI